MQKELESFLIIYSEKDEIMSNKTKFISNAFYHDAKIVVIQGVAHMFPVSNNKNFVDLMIDYLKR
jgi:pimeloyl-ACP methyl ester carboxylesterase